MTISWVPPVYDEFAAAVERDLRAHIEAHGLEYSEYQVQQLLDPCDGIPPNLIEWAHEWNSGGADYELDPEGDDDVASWLRVSDQVRDRMRALAEAVPGHADHDVYQARLALMG